MELTHFSLFSGVGGIDLASEWAGFQTVGQCELADYPYKVLCKHWPDVPKWRDIRDVTNESVRAAGIDRIDLLSGGWPCQPFSLAGKRRGKEDDRYLWPEMFRVIQELRPRWVLGENVTGIDGLALDDVLSHLESIGYETAPPLEIPACAVNAVHVRERVFVLAHSSGTQCASGTEIERILRALPENWAVINNTNGPGQTQSGEVLADTDSQGLSPQWVKGGVRETEGKTCSSHERGSMLGQGWDRPRREPEPGLGRVFNGPPGGVHRPPAPLGCEQYEWEPPRVAKGVKNRRQRLECLGNMVIPWQVYPILKAIYEIERCTD